MTIDAQRFYEDILQLQNREVEVLLRGGTRLSGKITNTMFDSFIVEAAGKKSIVRFQDVAELLPR